MGAIISGEKNGMPSHLRHTHSTGRRKAKVLIKDAELNEEISQPPASE